MSNAPMLAPSELELIDGTHERIIAGALVDGASVAGWELALPRPLREWYGLKVAGEPAITPRGLAWLMWRLDPPRAMRVLAGMLDAVLPPGADPRSCAVVPLLRRACVLSTVQGDEDLLGEAKVAVMEAKSAALDASGNFNKRYGNPEQSRYEPYVFPAFAAVWAVRALMDTDPQDAALWAFDAAESAVWAAKTRPDLDIGAILLTEWEKE